MIINQIHCGFVSLQEEQVSKEAKVRLLLYEIKSLLISSACGSF